MWPFGSSNEDLKISDINSQTTPVLSADAKRADTEFAEFLQSISSQDPDTPRTTRQAVAPSAAIGGIAPPLTEHKQESLNDGRRVYDDGTVDITPDRMHPHSMSCRQAFDQAFYCQSLGGKFNDIYRFGELKSCSDQWGAFWFCMRTRTLGDGEKARQTVDYLRQRDSKKRAEHGSSEDVWEIRTRSVREAFGKDPDNATGQRQMTVQS